MLNGHFYWQDDRGSHVECFSFIFHQLAMREACKYVEEKLSVKVRYLSPKQMSEECCPFHAYCHTDLNLNFYLHFQVDRLGKDSLINCAKTSMSSKLINSDSDFFATMLHLAFLFIYTGYSITFARVITNCKILIPYWRSAFVLT
jgi:hypothetical protein